MLFRSIWRNPVPGSAESAPLVTFTSTSPNLAGPVNFSKWFSGGTAAYDEYRIGTTWADVTPIPEPSTVFLFAVGLLALLWARRRAVSLP